MQLAVGLLNRTRHLKNAGSSSEDSKAGAKVSSALTNYDCDDDVILDVTPSLEYGSRSVKLISVSTDLGHITV